jgi:hypothetical protein
MRKPTEILAFSMARNLGARGFAVDSLYFQQT